MVIHAKVFAVQIIKMPVLTVHANFFDFQVKKWQAKHVPAMKKYSGFHSVDKWWQQ